MSKKREKTAGRARSLIALGVITFALALPVTSASAGFLDLLFGGGRRYAPAPVPAPLAPLVNSFANPSGGVIDGERRGGGPSVAYCVRLCDGHAFPVQSSSSPAQACASMCPAATTKVFAGGTIDHAVSPDGKRYADLPNAFVYRKQLVAGCTCNGKTPGGLVRVDVKSDPTLRPGDIVATNSGLMSYRGSNGRNAEFTPVQDRKLANIEIRPASAALAAHAEVPPPSHVEEPAPKGRRAQR